MWDLQRQRCGMREKSCLILERIVKMSVRINGYGRRGRRKLEWTDDLSRRHCLYLPSNIWICLYHLDYCIMYWFYQVLIADSDSRRTEGEERRIGVYSMRINYTCCGCEVISFSWFCNLIASPLTLSTSFCRFLQSSSRPLQAASATTTTRSFIVVSTDTYVCYDQYSK